MIHIRNSLFLEITEKRIPFFAPYIIYIIKMKETGRKRSGHGVSHEKMGYNGIVTHTYEENVTKRGVCAKLPINDQKKGEISL